MAHKRKLTFRMGDARATMPAKLVPRLPAKLDIHHDKKSLFFNILYSIDGNIFNFARGLFYSASVQVRKFKYVERCYGGANYAI